MTFKRSTRRPKWAHVLCWRELLRRDTTVFAVSVATLLALFGWPSTGAQSADANRSRHGDWETVRLQNARLGVCYAESIKDVSGRNQTFDGNDTWRMRVTQDSVDHRAVVSIVGVDWASQWSDGEQQPPAAWFYKVLIGSDKYDSLSFFYPPDPWDLLILIEETGGHVLSVPERIGRMMSAEERGETIVINRSDDPRDAVAFSMRGFTAALRACDDPRQSRDDASLVSVAISGPPASQEVRVTGAFYDASRYDTLAFQVSRPGGEFSAAELRLGDREIHRLTEFDGEWYGNFRNFDAACRDPSTGLVKLLTYGWDDRRYFLSRLSFRQDGEVDRRWLADYAGEPLEVRHSFVQCAGDERLWSEGSFQPCRCTGDAADSQYSILADSVDRKLDREVDEIPAGEFATLVSQVRAMDQFSDWGSGYKVGLDEVASTDFQVVGLVFSRDTLGAHSGAAATGTTFYLFGRSVVDSESTPWKALVVSGNTRPYIDRFLDESTLCVRVSRFEFRELFDFHVSELDGLGRISSGNCPATDDLDQVSVRLDIGAWLLSADAESEPPAEPVQVNRFVGLGNLTGPFARAFVYTQYDDYDAAERLLRDAHIDSQSHQIMDFGKQYAEISALIAAGRMRQGENSQAADLLQRGMRRALVSYREYLGAGPSLARGYALLANAYVAMEEWEKATDAYERAIQVRDDTTPPPTSSGSPPFGPVSMDGAEVQMRVAAHHHIEGEYARASEVLKRVLRGLEESDPLYRTTMVRLYAVYAQAGDTESAISIYEQADYQLQRDIRRIFLEVEHYNQVLGAVEDHKGQDLALVVDSGAKNLVWRRQLELASGLYRAALHGLDEDEDGYVSLLRGLADVYERVGHYRVAVNLRREMLELRDKGGYNDVHFVDDVIDLARLHVIAHDLDGAHFLKAAVEDSVSTAPTDVPPRQVGHLGMYHFMVGDHARALPYLDRALSQGYDMMSHIAGSLSERTHHALRGSSRQMLDAYLSLVLDAGIDTCSASDQQKGAPNAVCAAFEHIVQWKGDVLATRRAYGLMQDDPKIDEAFNRLQKLAGQMSQVNATSEQRQRFRSSMEWLESKIATLALPYHNRRRGITATELGKRLPEDSVLLDYFVFNRMSIGKSDWNQKATLLAFVVHADGTLRLFDLGDHSTIEELINQWRDEVSTREVPDQGVRLRARLWDPVAASMPETGTVLVSLDGALGRLSLAALPGRENGTYLLHDYRLVFLPVPRLLVTDYDVEGAVDTERALLLIGDVNYESVEEFDGVKQPKRHWRRAHDRAIAQERSRTNYKWGPLNTLGEVLAIRNTFDRAFESDDSDVLLLQSTGASERAFRDNARGFKYIHIATHGFFAAADGGAVDPRVLSGIVLAGANTAAEVSGYDGILTSLEVATLRLPDTSLVTLSACDTALGESVYADGLVSIQRAFQIAGVQSTIASLWAIPDDRTSKLMRTFYEKLWKDGLPVGDALRAAQIEVIESARAPYFWAAFQLSVARNW